jgi:hypothetical protein
MVKLSATKVPWSAPSLTRLDLTPELLSRIVFHPAPAESELAKQQERAKRLFD